MQPSADDVTQLLRAWGNGNKEALDNLIPLVYEELRRRAHYYMNRERVGHSLQTSALVNEAYVRLVDYNRMQWQDRAHFFAVAAQLMRRILVDHARSRGYAKRGGEARKVSLDGAAEVSAKQLPEIIALDDALTDLSRFDERKSRIVELRYFGGLSIEETAEVMGISSPTVQREWRRAKAWLHREISRGEEDEA